MAPLFMGDDDELQGLIKDHMILPYLFGDFHPSHIQEYAGCLLIAFEKTCQRRGGYPPHHLRRKLASLFRQPRRQRCPGSYLSYFYIYIRKFLTNCRSQDGASHCAKILSAMYAALNSDPSDPDVIIKLDISDACGLKEGDNVDTCCGELRNMFEYFRSMRTTKYLRYFDYCGNVLDCYRRLG
jgi:hypothetical protein